MTVYDLNKPVNNILDIDFKAYQQAKRKTRKKHRCGMSDIGALLDMAVTIGASCAIASGLNLSGIPYFFIFMLSCAIIGGLLTAFFDNIGF